MKIIKFLTIFLAALALFVSCKEKKQEEVIIVKTTPEPPKPKQTIAMDSITKTTDVEWGSNKYTVQVTRKADKSLAIVKDDANDDKYYDNRITLKVLREDGTEAISKTFTKENFKAKTNSQFYDSFVLLALMYNKVEGNSLKFIVSIGEPDPYSDNYTNLLLTLTKTGEVTLATYVIDEKTGDEADMEP